MASIKDLKRMCQSYKGCDSCPLEQLFIDGVAPCTPSEFPNSVDEVIDKWVAEHPVKTYAMDFFEKFPNAVKEPSGDPLPCIGAVYSEFYDKSCPVGGCSECWNQEMKEDD